MKRIACVLLVLALLLGSFTVAADEGTMPARLLGDVNGDGKVTTTDARLILQGMAGIRELPSAVRFLANADGDERVSTTDARYVLRYAAGIETTPKAGVIHVGEAAVFNCALAQLPFDVATLFQMMGATPAEGDVPYYALQLDSKQQLEELVSMGTSFLGENGISAEAKEYLKARDEAFFATDSVVLVLYPETYSQYALEGFTLSPNGAWIVQLHEYTRETAAAPNANSLRVLAMDVDRAAMESRGIAAVEVAVQESLAS